MAFPATFNINYYRGDSYSFILNPKNSDGTPFNLATYTGELQVKATRDPEANVLIFGNVSIDSPITGSITCTIDPEDGRTLAAGNYVYDLEITNASGRVFTLVTGRFTVTNDVTRVV
jgi:hypothetical protein